MHTESASRLVYIGSEQRCVRALKAGPHPRVTVKHKTNEAGEGALLMAHTERTKKLHAQKVQSANFQ